MQRDPILIVVAAIVVAQGRVLLARRRPGVHLGDCWEFPGGKVERGEGPRAALRRELDEELGVKATVGEPFAFNDHVYPDRRVLLLTYRTRIEGTPRPLGCAAIDWFTPPQVRRLRMPPADAPILRRLLAEMRGVPRPNPAGSA